MQVKSGGSEATVSFTRPLVLSGDRRKHRNQLRALNEEAIAAVIAVLGEQFGVSST